MSESSENQQLGRITKVAGWAVILAIAGGATWVSSMQMDLASARRSIDTHLLDINRQQVELNSIQVWKAATEASRFTASDHLIYATRTSQEIAENRTRVARVEDAIISIKETLNRIERNQENVRRVDGRAP